MLSRVADNLYWMGRYMERAEHAARVMGVHLNLMLEQDAGSDQSRWSQVLECLGAQQRVEEDALAAAQGFALNQIVTSISAARENARQVREQISSEVWEQLNRLYHETKRMDAPELFRAQPFDVLVTVAQNSHLWNGITDSTMLHGEGWQFIQAGRFIERVQQTARLVECHFSRYFRTSDEPVTASEHMEWIGLLRSCTAFEAYCKVYTAELRPERVAEFLLLNPDFPHSVRFAVDRLQRSLEAVHQATGTRKSDRLGKLAGRLTAALRYTPLEEIMTGLQSFSANIRRMCAQIHSGIYQVYITYTIDAAIDT